MNNKRKIINKFSFITCAVLALITLILFFFPYSRYDFIFNSMKVVSRTGLLFLLFFIVCTMTVDKKAPNRKMLCIYVLIVTAPLIIFYSFMSVWFSYTNFYFDSPLEENSILTKEINILQGD